MRVVAISLALYAALFVFLGQARAQAFPSKPIRIVSSTAAGGLPDVVARTVAQKVSESVGQPVLVENRPGAGQIIGIEAVINMPPDGYALLITDTAAYAVNPILNRSVRYDMLRDLAPVSLAANAPIILAVPSSLGVSTFKEFLALARAKPGLPFGSAGTGTSGHLSMELLKTLAKLEFTHVSYKGGAALTPGVASGDVVGGFVGMNSAVPLVQAGRLKIIAVAPGQRSALLPEVPTLAESGVPGYDVTLTLGFFAPVKTPRDIVGKLSDEFVKALKTDDVRKKLASLGAEAVGSTPEEYAQAIRNEIAQYAKALKGVRID